MDKTTAQTKTVDEYIDGFSQDIQYELKKIRQAIKQAAPEAQETIAYQMPAYKLNKKPLVYFAAFKDHIGFFPTPSGINAFKKELADYETSRGTVRLPLDRPVPLELLKKIVRFKVEENTGKKK